jgi:hypothetical protein
LAKRSGRAPDARDRFASPANKPAAQAFTPSPLARLRAGAGIPEEYVMNKTLTVTVAALALGFAAPVFASTDVSSKALMDVTAAKSDVAAGRMQMAIERAERAQTTLLNAKQAGDETAPSALDALKNAAQDIMDKKKSDALAALDTAINALKS